jgi:dTDP-4-dehydrorhamnose 3,5-epimerase
MKQVATTLKGVVVLEPKVFEDARGFFLETYHQEKFAALGITDRFVQDNHSGSTQGTLRGLHYQRRRPQAKLCRVISGEVLDVVVDIRRGSPTFGKWESVRLSAENHRMIYVPIGFAHGFVALSERVEFLYKCSDFYAPEEERGIAWNDPQLGIDWQLETEPLLSGKDAQNPTLDKIPVEDWPLYTEE